MVWRSAGRRAAKVNGRSITSWMSEMCSRCSLRPSMATASLRVKLERVQDLKTNRVRNAIEVRRGEMSNQKGWRRKYLSICLLHILDSTEKQRSSDIQPP